VRYREWYGAKKDASGKTVPNVGLKMKNEDIGAGIQERETLRVKEPDGTLRTVREQIVYGVLDPRCFANEGGTPIAEAIFKGGQAPLIVSGDHRRRRRRRRPGGLRMSWSLSSASSKEDPWVQLQSARALRPRVQVARRRCDVRMPERRLHLRQGRPAVDGVAGVRVAKPVG
jgi:hypothetical protein